LGEDVVVSRGAEELGLAEEGLRCDAAEFEGLLDLGRAEEALELYRGDLMAGFHLSDCAEFERWLERERTRLRKRAHDAALAKAELEEKKGNTIGAAHWARWAVAIAPEDEGGVRKLVSLLDRLGDRAGAIHEYEAFARQVREDYDLEPSPETQELASAIRSRRLPNGAVGNDGLEPVPAAAPGGDAQAHAGTRAPVQTWRGRVALATVTMVMAAGGWLAYSNLPGNRTVLAAPVDPKSMAVLPFTNLDEDTSEDYLAAGVEEDILDLLSAISDIRVFPANGVYPNATEETSLRAIGKHLGVAALLQGSVRRDGDRVQVTVKLVDVESQELIWGNSYSEEMANIFAIESEVARGVAVAVGATLSTEERQRIITRRTANPTPLDFVARARSLINRATGSSDEEKQRMAYAIQLARNAVELDSSYAFAQSALAFGLWRRFGMGFGEAWLDSAIRHAERAVELNPELPEGYMALGATYTARGWLSGVISAYDKALRLDPSYTSPMSNLGVIYGYMGRFDKSASLIERAFEIQGGSWPGGYMQTGWIDWLLGSYRDAERWLQSGVELYPEYARTHHVLAEVYLSQGRYQRARDQIQAALELDPDDYSTLGVAGLVELLSGNHADAIAYYERALDIVGLYRTKLGLVPSTEFAFAHLRRGQPEQARELFRRSMSRDERVLQRGSEHFAPRYDLARIHAVQGNTEEAYQWLEQAIDAGWRHYYTYMGPQDPLLANLQGDERFQRMMARVKAQVDSMRALVEQR
jgi:tetratricopeptide (TPR) repeat protein